MACWIHLPITVKRCRRCRARIWRGGTACALCKLPLKEGNRQ